MVKHRVASTEHIDTADGLDRDSLGYLTSRESARLSGKVGSRFGKRPSPSLVKEELMNRLILAVSLLSPLSFSLASAQITKMTVDSAIGAVHFPAWMAKESGI